MIKLTYFGHSCFLIEGSKGKVAIDPFLKGNPHVRVNPNEIICQAVLVTHGHSDHLGDAVEISKKNHAPIIGVFDFGEVTLTPALHSSGCADGTYGGTPCGFILKMDNRTVYHAGDTSLTYEMKLLSEMHNIDVALLPIGDNFTMGAADAAKAVELLKPKLAIPIHYNTFPEIQQDPEDFVDKVGDLARVKIMGFGETYELQ